LLALGAARTLLYESFTATFETQLDRELRFMAAAGASAESREGLSALLSKKQVDFKRGPAG